MEKVSDLKQPPVIGKFYLVPCILVNGKWNPINGLKINLNTNKVVAR